MGAANFTIFSNADQQWQVRRETNGCGYVSDAAWPTPLGAILHASQRAQDFFPVTVTITEPQKKAIVACLNDPTFDQWVAAGRPSLQAIWDGDYSDIVAAGDRDDYVGM
jgi:hypothetical protein